MICARRCIARTTAGPPSTRRYCSGCCWWGYLYGIKSEARLEEEINYNIAYKWFCGLDLTDKAPDATTISQNRRRRFRDNNIAEEIFNEILRQCIAKGLVGGAILYTDSTHIKAKANKHKKKQVEVAVTPEGISERTGRAGRSGA